jgi:hypothetical protein
VEQEDELAGVDRAGGDDLGPFFQLRTAPEDRLGQDEAQDRQAEHVGAEDRPGFNRQA